MRDTLPGARTDPQEIVVHIASGDAESLVIEFTPNDGQNVVIAEVQLSVQNVVLRQAVKKPPGRPRAVLVNARKHDDFPASKRDAHDDGVVLLNAARVGHTPP